jgi:calcineurin-like phosphoesterase family protein
MIKFEKIDISIDKVWITFDTHYSHTGICKGVSQWEDKSGCRDFDTLEDMNNAIVDGINRYVTKDSLLIHGGDWSFGGKDKVFEFRNKLNVDVIYLTRGNHDHNIWPLELQNVIINDIHYLQFGMHKFVFCHYPMLHWHEMHKGSFMCHGHLHGHEDDVMKLIHRNYRTMDAGIDEAFRIYGEYRPFRLTEVIDLLKHKNTMYRHED